MNFLDTRINEDVNQIIRIGDMSTDSKRWKIGGVLTFLLFFDLFVFVFALCSSLFPSSNRSWKVHWFKKKDRPWQQTNEQLDWRKLWGRSKEHWSRFWWSLCSLCHWASCFHFGSAQLSTGNSYSLKVSCTCVSTGTLTQFPWVQASVQLVQLLQTVTEHMMKDACVSRVWEVSNVC